MINFIKNDKYLSIINVIIVITFLIFNISYYWFLLLELTIISIFLVFMLYRFYLRSRIKASDMKKIKELYKMNFNYEDYKDIYEEEDDFNLEIVEYKHYLNEIISSILRMDKCLKIENYDILEKGLNNLEKNIKDNKKRKKNCELIKDVISIIKKYYDNEYNRKISILKYKKVIILLVLLLLLSVLLIVIFFINNNIAIYSGLTSLYIVILFIINIILSNYNKK